MSCYYFGCYYGLTFLPGFVVVGAWIFGCLIVASLLITAIVERSVTCALLAAGLAYLMHYLVS